LTYLSPIKIITKTLYASIYYIDKGV